MRVAHLLRKYNPSEWGGTETAVKRLLDGLRHHGVDSTVFCPSLEETVPTDPLSESGYTVRRYKTCVPVWGISDSQRQQLISVGGNLMSFDLFPSLLKEDAAVIHTHAGNRLGGIALTVAKLRKLPLVATIHGGILDLPPEAKRFLQKPLEGGTEWGKLFGFIFRARKVLAGADAILTCNKREAELQRAQFPGKRVLVQPHGVAMNVYQPDCRAAAQLAFPQIKGKDVLLSVGRIDAVKNQGWIIDRAPELLGRFPQTLIVLAGACTDAGYGKMLEKKIQQLGLDHRILLTGGLPPSDQKLIGLFQSAKALVLPSLSETFGLVILEAWAAGIPVIASATSGARDLIQNGENGWLFELNDTASFLKAVDSVLTQPQVARQMAASGAMLVAKHYDVNVLGGKVKKLYEELIEEKK